MHAKTAIVSLVLLAAAPALAANEITCVSIGTGGGTLAGMTVQMREVCGQPVVAVAQSTGYTVRGGELSCLAGTVSAVDPGGQTDLPARIALHNPVPNPMNPQTTIAYDLPQPTTVALCVFDLAGRRVRTLRMGPQGAGRRTATWDGRDDGGRLLASGVYVLRLDAGGQHFSRKLLLLE